MTHTRDVERRTTGLGGDSEVHVIDEGLTGGVTLGPKRVLPISLIAHEDAERVHATLDEQLRSDTPGEYDARFVRRVPGMDLRRTTTTQTFTAQATFHTAYPCAFRAWLYLC